MKLSYLFRKFMAGSTLLTGLLISFNQHAASFDCSKAYSSVEKTICADPSLSAQDEALGKLYAQVKSVTGNSIAFKNAAQKNWQLRKNCTTKQCLSNWYANSNHLYRQMLTKNSSSCIKEGQSLRLTGTLLRITYPGPPNYESVAQGDRPEIHWVLQPDQKIKCAVDAPQFDNHTKMQLVMYGNEYRDYKSLIGRNVTVTGNLMYADNGNHHTSLLITVERIAAAK